MPQSPQNTSHPSPPGTPSPHPAQHCSILSPIPLLPGEEWLVKRVGAYLPGVYEEVVDVVDAYVLTDKVPGIVTLARGFPCPCR